MSIEGISNDQVLTTDEDQPCFYSLQHIQCIRYPENKSAIVFARVQCSQ